MACGSGSGAAYTVLAFAAAAEVEVKVEVESKVLQVRRVHDFSVDAQHEGLGQRYLPK